MKLASWPAQNWSWHVSNLEYLWLPQNRWSKCSRSSKTFATATIALTIAGAGFGDLTNARNVITTYRSISSSADSAKSGLVIGVKETGCEKPSWGIRKQEEEVEDLRNKAEAEGEPVVEYHTSKTSGLVDCDTSSRVNSCKAKLTYRQRASFRPGSHGV